MARNAVPFQEGFNGPASHSQHGDHCAAFPRAGQRGGAKRAASDGRWGAGS